MRFVFRHCLAIFGISLCYYFVIIALLASFGFEGYSQVNVRQGTEEDLMPRVSSTEFRSPMVLEYVLSKLRYIPIRGGKKSQSLVVEDFRAYDCERVVLEKLEIARRNTDDPEIRELIVVSHLYTKPPKDKSVTLIFEIVSEGDSIAQSTVSEVDVEEQYHIEVKTSISYPRGLMESDPSPRLKIVMSVENDNL